MPTCAADDAARLGWRDTAAMVAAASQLPSATRGKLRYIDAGFFHDASLQAKTWPEENKADMAGDDDC